nr:flagellar hook-length control protein FliK [Variovorax boronicumulans]
MNTLPLQTLLPQPGTQPAAVLPAALLGVLAPVAPLSTAAAPASAQPRSFDRTLQLLLDGSAALPTPGAAASALTTPVSHETGTDTDSDTRAADAGTALPFDPALASLQPPPAIAVPLPAASGTPAQAPVRPAGAAAVAVQAATGAAPALPTGLAAPAPAALGPTPAAKPQAAPADTATTALPPERAGVSTGPVPAAASAPQDSVEPRTGEAAPQGRAPSLLQQLGDRIAVQLERGSERVVIRLDPPHRGQIEIHIRQDASGATQVQLSASHGDVVRQLQAIGDGLRQELAQRHGGDVSVQVAQQQARGEADGRQRQGEQRQQQPGRALDEPSEAGQHFAHFALATERP